MVLIYVSIYLLLPHLAFDSVTSSIIRSNTFSKVDVITSTWNHAQAGTFTLIPGYSVMMLC